MEENDESNKIFPHGLPTDQWKDLKRSKIPLSTTFISNRWREVVGVKVPDLTLAHYLAARFIAFGYPIPPRVKDAVVDEAPDEVKKTLNEWNKLTGSRDFRRSSIPFGDIRIVAPLTAVAASVVHNYDMKNPDELDKIARTLFGLSDSFEWQKYTQELIKKNKTPE